MEPVRKMNKTNGVKLGTVALESHVSSGGPAFNGETYITNSFTTGELWINLQGRNIICVLMKR